jgi:hypothetical protein
VPAWQAARSAMNVARRHGAGGGHGFVRFEQSSLDCLAARAALLVA